MAYSLHQIDSGDSNVIRVRRSSDSTEQDFTATQVSDGTLTTFTGAGSGYIAKWYNLGSGGATYDLVQTTAANQPRIVNAGTLDTDPNNGNPAMFFNGSSNYLSLSTSWQTTSTITQCEVFNRASTGIRSITLANSGAANPFLSLWFTDNATYWRPATAAGVAFANDTNTGDFLEFLYYVSSNAYLFRNNTGNANNPRSYTHATPYSCDNLGRRNADYHSGYYQFFALWTSDESGNRTGIQNKINNVLSVY